MQRKKQRNAQLPHDLVQVPRDRVAAVGPHQVRAAPRRKISPAVTKAATSSRSLQPRLEAELKSVTGTERGAGSGEQGGLGARVSFSPLPGRAMPFGTRFGGRIERVEGEEFGRRRALLAMSSNLPDAARMR